MADVEGFWSYVRKDDELVGDRISDLRKNIEDEYELQTGEELKIFQDTEDLLWGDDWREKLNQNLAKTVFFIPIITPNYFDSEKCREELRRFSTAAEKKGLKKLVLPIIYIDVEGLHRDWEDIEDELIKRVKARQYKEWMDLRLEGQDSPPYRKGVSELAEKLIEIVDKVSEIPATTQKEVAQKTLDLDDEELDKPGYLDLLSNFQEDMEEWVDTIYSISSDIQELGEIGEQYGTKFEKLNEQNAPNSARLAQVKKLSEELEEPAQKILNKGESYAANLMEVDPSINAMFEMLESFPEEEGGGHEHLKDFFEGIDTIFQSSKDGAEELKELLNTLTPLKEFSRDLRKPINKINQGLQHIVDAHSVIRDWYDRKEEYLEENEIEFE